MASQVQTSDAWIRARDRYVQDLNEEEQQKYFKASPESLLDDSSSAEKFHGTNSTTRRVMEKLQPFVAAIVQYGDAIDVYSSTYSLALGPIWGSVKVLLHIAREFGKYFDKLVEMFARIGDVLPRFKTYERLFSNHERLVHALSMAYLDVITFCTNAKAVFRRGQRSSKTTLKVTFKLLWKPFDQQFGQQLSDFRQHQKNVEKEAGLAHMIESADARAMVLADQKQLEKRRREDNRLRILSILHAVDYEAKHRKLQNLRLGGTGNWLFRQAKYIQWKTSGRSELLCCRGIPGCGKSILASNLVDHLVGSLSASAAPSTDVIYYYCDYADQRTLHHTNILGSLLKQLFLNHQISEHIETQLLQLYAGGTRSPAEKDLSDIFYSVVKSRPKLYIIFDGLDECEKPVWKAMLKILEHLGNLEQCTVKIFLTCVEEDSISHHLANYGCVQLSPAATAEDIKSYVTSSVRSKIEGGELRIRNSKLQQDIITELSSRANGMILWVFFQLNSLCESSSDAMIRETLKNLPEGLGETYRRILVAISSSPLRAGLAQKVFQWATVAKRPLNVEELKEAVAFGPDDKGWEEDKIPHEDIMFESCRGLIIKDGDDGTVHFAHHTVRQYLTGGLTTKVDPTFEVSTLDAEDLAARTCVAYLSFSDFETQLTSTTPMVTLEQKGILESGGPLWIPSVLGIRKPLFNIPYKLLRGNPALQSSDSDYWKYLTPHPGPKYSPSTDLKDKYRLLCYAIEHWEPHTRFNHLTDYVFARRFENLAKHKTLAFDFRPWGSNQHFGTYGCVGCPSASSGGPVAKDLPYIAMIHYAARVGNFALLTTHDSTEIKIDDYIHHERYHQETLLIACRHDRIGIVKYLIQRAEYDFSDGRAINAAAAAGHAGVLQYLLSLGQYSFNQQIDDLLLSAARHGHEAVFEVLLEAGATVKAYDQLTDETVFEIAAMNGHESIIRMLLGKSLPSSSVHQLVRNGLHLAAANGHVAATRALLESGFNIHRVNGDQYTALHVAAFSGHSAIVETLLEYGAGLSYVGDDETPVHLAARNGHVNVLESMNKLYPSSLSQLNGSGKTLLHLAAAEGHDRTIRWLVENEFDVNATDWEGRTPLFYATRLGDETAVRVLLELGATVFRAFGGRRGAISGEIEPPKGILVYATDDGKFPILQMLLENVREDRQRPDKAKCEPLIEAVLAARSQGSVRATEVLEQALLIYSGGKSFEELRDEWSSIFPLGQNTATRLGQASIYLDRDHSE